MVDDIPSAASDAAQNGLLLFFSWVLTPTGATLTIAMLVLGVLGVAGRFLGWSVKLVKTLATIAGVLLFVWIITGILSSMGIPVREWMVQASGWIPRLGQWFMTFLERLFEVAG